MSRHRFYQVDAFTSRVFSGNPAGVCELDDWLPDRTLIQIAAENALSETAFFVPRTNGFDLRWFTPESEVDLCGHATLATAHVLYERHGFKGPMLQFHTRSGLLEVRRQKEAYAMTFPARVAKATTAPAALLNALGPFQPEDVLKSRDYLVVLESEEQVRSLRPDLRVLSGLDTFGVIVTAPGEQADFVSRFFAPGAGIPEDPVTGSAHCTLTPYWSQRLGKVNLNAQQVSQRGGEINCQFRGQHVVLTGQAQLFLEGHILVPGES